MRRLAVVILLVWASPVLAAEAPGQGPLSSAACTDCHADEAAAWDGGVHAGPAPAADCVACHGERHDAVAARARQSDACVACHGGAEGAAPRSYATSKHGVIAGLERARWDWSQPLAEGNYRAPTCAYCHMHDGAHGQLLSGDTLEEACFDCHSPRFVETLISSGERTLEIGRMKLREAEAAAAGLPDAAVAELLDAMRTVTLRDLRLGIGHQSPDYQWWYGHAALDGDLLRIKAALSDLERRRAIAEQ